MKIKVEDNQTLLDIAMQYYGTAEALGKILLDNPQIQNEPQAVIEAGYEIGEFRPEIKLKIASTIFIDDDSRMIKKSVINKINRSVNTYMTRQWQEQLNK